MVDLDPEFDLGSYEGLIVGLVVPGFFFHSNKTIQCSEFTFDISRKQSIIKT